MTVEAAAAERQGAFRWVVWGLGALAFTYAFFHRVAPSVMVDELMRDFAVGGAVLGNLSAVYFYPYAGLQIPVGLIVDRWGPRRVLTAALAVSVLGSVLFAWAPVIDVAYAGRLLIGGGVGFGFVSTLALATNWFPARRFAFLSGLTMLAGMAGGIFGQAPQAALVQAIGWRGTVLGTGVAGAVLAALIWLVVRDRPRAAAAVHAAAPRAAGREVLAGLGRVVRHPQTWIIALYGATLSGTMLAFGALWGVPYLVQTRDLSRPAAAFCMSLVLIGWALGGPLAGWVSDHIGRRRLPMIVAAVVGLVTIAAVVYLPGLPLPAIQALLVINGMAGGTSVLTYATAREHNPGPSVGSAYGFTNMAMVSGGALFQPFIGWLLDLNWGGRIEAGARIYSAAAYETAFLALPACFLVALVAALLIRETWCRPVAA